MFAIFFLFDVLIKVIISGDLRRNYFYNPRDSSSEDLRSLWRMMSDVYDVGEGVDVKGVGEGVDKVVDEVVDKVVDDKGGDEYGRLVSEFVCGLLL